MSLAPSDRYTIGFNREALQIMQKIIDDSHFKNVPDVVRAAIAVFADLLGAEERGLRVVLRDESNREWKYSPHKPGKAVPLALDDSAKVVPLRLAASDGEHVAPVAEQRVDSPVRERLVVGRRRPRAK